jgi:dTDP-4-amino-4,6-dideoxygalactose transaminase
MGPKIFRSNPEIQKIIEENRLPEPVYVTRPQMPPLESYTACLEKIWESRWLTNNGPYHREFEAKLARYLEVENLNLFVNGTIALLVALQALRINSGEVITTPYTFPASTHVLHWNRIKPVFCDIDSKTFNIDPNHIEKLITPETKAILGVHVYGNPCDVDAIQEIADRHGLHVIYDAAHAFGVKIGTESILKYGDISAMSFHATKLFSSIEGGALISKTRVQAERIYFLKNFGIAGEETVIGPGINGKMNEFQAAFGLLELDLVDQEIADRKELTEIYRSRLADVPGITVMQDIPDVKHNYGYFPILVNAEQYGFTRDELHLILRECNIVSRKYFYPLCSHYSCYSAFPSAQKDNLPVAERVSSEVLCLPLYGKLSMKIIHSVCDIISGLNWT